VPRPVFYDAANRRLPDSAAAARVAYSVYEIRIRPGVLYQPHPAFARDENGRYRYHDMKPGELESLYEIRDFKHTGTRELVAADFAFEIRRLAHPHQHSPIFGLMSEYIVGLKEYAAALQEAAKSLPPDGYLDINSIPLEGVEVVDAHTDRI
jgi:hypothetical protein